MNKEIFNSTARPLYNRQGLLACTLFFFSASSLFAASVNQDNYYCQSPAGNSTPYRVDDSNKYDSLAYQPNKVEDYQKLRVVLERGSKACVISQAERELLEQFAIEKGINLDWHYVDAKWQLLPELFSARADIIVGQDLSLLSGMTDDINFTLPWTVSSYKIVERRDGEPISRLEDLAGRRVAAYENTKVWSRLEELQDEISGLSLEAIPKDISYVDVMNLVRNGVYDVAVASSLFLDDYIPSNVDLRADFNITSEKTMAWAVNAKDIALHDALNQYLNKQHITHDIETVYFDDMPEIKERGLLRVITSQNPSHYYMNNGKLYGFEYELLRTFAAKHRLRLEMIITESQDDMFRKLANGEGDLIAASLPGNETLNKTRNIQYSDAYNYSSPVLVGRKNETALFDIRDLDGRRVTLSEDSPYWSYLARLEKAGNNFELVKADKGITSEGVLLMVALGMYDLTIVGNHQLKTTFADNAGLEKQFVLAEPQAHRWAVRAENKLLLNALNDYADRLYRSEFYNIVHAKYFEREYFPKTQKENIAKQDVLSPFDNETKEFSDKYGFDWRLITALMFQESRFDPDAYSDAGAMGVMQLIPETAELMGLQDASNPVASINAGVRYLSYLRDKFEDSILLQDRTWFALASYNAGYGRIKQARERAEAMGLNKDRWFDNVELAMMEMAKPIQKEGEASRICRCGQTVVYVREIRTRYFNYIRLLDTRKVAYQEQDLLRKYKNLN